ncbi:piwi-like protein Siwi isoform X2 [Rhopalosiphum maidis]|uniref:piwi-like protein Siwi isoform X2 n=1 Tax=Rhopalosiphum maidis TaxID=43146 RepID=UPI000EFF0700|nr:piwi-like protein Siwi isoform X2 [Rhopalosiphum maidis]
MYISYIVQSLNFSCKKLPMDTNTVWRARGRARGSNPPNQLQQPQQYRRPRPMVSQVRNMQPQPGSQQAIRPPSVEQVTSKISSLTTGDVPMPIGRGAVRGRQSIENTYFRLVKPESSISGKQGFTGQPIELISNYFPIKTYTDWSLYQYRVDFNPPQDRINIQRGLLSVHKEFLGTYIFDGTMLFSRKKYEPNILELTSKQIMNDEIVIVTLKFTSVIEKGDYVSIQIFNLLLRKSLGHLKLTLVGRNYYDAKAKIDIPKYKLQLWPGYETTIGMFDNGLLLRSEISTKIMREETVFDFLKECLKSRNENPNWMVKFKMAIIGSVVLTRYNNQTYRIDDIDETSSTTSTFLKKDGSSISYIDYYKQRYNINISNQRQPMLISKKKKSFRIEGEETELVYLVPELCTMTGITQNMINNRFLMQDIAQFTRTDPTERISKYNTFIRRVLTTPMSTESLTQWNLTLSNKLITIPGRVLPQEMLYSGKNDSTYPAGINADWTAHLRSLPMYRHAEISNWVIVTPYMWSSDVGQFTNTLLRVANNMHFSLSRPRIVEIKDTQIKTYSDSLDRVVNEMSPLFILCVILTERNDLYSVIKRKLCIDRGIPSQVVLAKQVQKNNMSVCTKIAIQINCKLGGAPWRVKIPESKMMIIGFDVYHDKQNKNKSYGALIATMDKYHTKFFSCVEPHQSGEEISPYFATSIYKALTKYKSMNEGALPQSIIIYRDGVGDGQLSYVHKTEVEMVKRTCKDFYGEQKVGLAFIIVKKRISTRFFCKNKENYKNPPPGTVIDNSVTDPTMYDFYLVPQHVTKGTVTPTHYNVIVDTLNEIPRTILITPDILQRLTYKLTHLYYNWSGTVRVPGVCQLAHKLAFLVGNSLHTYPNPSLEEFLYFL